MGNSHLTTPSALLTDLHGFDNKLRNYLSASINRKQSAQSNRQQHQRSWFRNAGAASHSRTAAGVAKAGPPGGVVGGIDRSGRVNLILQWAAVSPERHSRPHPLCHCCCSRLEHRRRRHDPHVVQIPFSSPVDPMNWTYRILSACGERLLIVTTVSRLCKLGSTRSCTLRLAEPTNVV